MKQVHVDDKISATTSIMQNGKEFSMRGTNTVEEKIRNINRVFTDETLPYWSIVSIDVFF